MLLVAFAAVWVGRGIAPRCRQGWLLENVLVLAAIPLLLWSHRRLSLGNASYVCLFAFGVLHESSHPRALAPRETRRHLERRRIQCDIITGRWECMSTWRVVPPSIHSRMRERP